MRSAKVPDPQFADAPPSLSDVVCLAVLEANMARPNALFTVSGTAWPAMRIHTRWAAIFEAAMLFLVDLASAGSGNLEASATQSGNGVDVTLTHRQTPAAPRHQLESSAAAEGLNALKKLDESLRLTFTEQTASIHLRIPPVLESQQNSRSNRQAM